MMLTLVWMLMLCSSVLSLDDKHANRTKIGQIQLGMSLADPRVINRGGLDNLHLLLAQKNYRLRVDLVDFNGSTPYAEYAYFTIGSPLNKYSLGFNLYLGGTAGDSLNYSSLPNNDVLINMKFSTRDNDNDVNGGSNCAVITHGAWWYKACAASNLNGNYTNDTSDRKSNIMSWYTWRNAWYPLKSTAMKFRPM